MIITSLLDTDTYKLTMQQIVASQYPDAWVRYEWILRSPVEFPNGFVHHLQDAIVDLSTLTLTDEEAAFLSKFPWMKAPYIDILRAYNFDPTEVYIEQVSPTMFKLYVEGPWYRTILWEVPLMAIISELYFDLHGMQLPDRWERAVYDKAFDLYTLGVNYADFGTRRRFSRKVHEKVVETHKGCGSCFKQKCFVGTSNVWLAMLNDVTPIGTQAHEWFSAHGALFGYRMANSVALDRWTDFYGGRLGIALTDTFTTDNFFEAFTPKFARLFDGVRHDSANPIEFAQKTIDHYKTVGIDPTTKTIVFSDSLNPAAVKAIEEFCKGKIRTAYGIGTNLTNDVGHAPLNMVIKLVGIARSSDKKMIPAIKLSDVPGKHTGDPNEIALCKGLLGLAG